MDIKRYKRQSDQLTELKRAHQWMIGVLTFGLLGLTLTNVLMMTQEKVIVVPPTFQTAYWLSAKQASQTYLRDFVRYLLQLRLSINSDNIQENRAILQRFVAKPYRPTFRELLDEDAEYLKKHHLSMSYHPTSIEMRSGLIHVSGFLSIYTKGVLSKTEPKQYQIKISLKHYVPELLEFKALSK